MQNMQNYIFGPHILQNYKMTLKSYFYCGNNLETVLKINRQIELPFRFDFGKLPNWSSDFVKLRFEPYSKNSTKQTPLHTKFTKQLSLHAKMTFGKQFLTNYGLVPLLFGNYKTAPIQT